MGRKPLDVTTEGRIDQDIRRAEIKEDTGTYNIDTLLVDGPSEVGVSLLFGWGFMGRSRSVHNDSEIKT